MSFYHFAEVEDHCGHDTRLLSLGNVGGGGEWEKFCGPTKTGSN